MKAMQEIKETAEKNKRVDTRTIKVMGFEHETNNGDGCDAIRQGDIYITRITEAEFKNMSLEAWDNGLQLAPGSTQGSRHIVENKTGDVQLFRVTNGNALQGPVAKAPSGLYVGHPEHGDIDLQVEGFYRITYQRAHAEELRRVAD